MSLRLLRVRLKVRRINYQLLFEGFFGFGVLLFLFFGSILVKHCFEEFSVREVIIWLVSVNIFSLVRTCLVLQTLHVLLQRLLILDPTVLQIV